MIIVADSGSTKCDWIISGQSEDTMAKTMGFNPFFHTTELINEKISENEQLSAVSSEVKAVYFYGAGCNSPERNDIVRRALLERFQNAKDIVVDHDLTAAALSTGKGEASIACILGTGSNSGYYDGANVHEVVPALGYVLGDEGSGAYFGKILMREFLYNRLPSHLQSEFGEEYSLTKESIFKAVYRDPNPNVYLASFMRFVSARKTDPYLKDMIYKGLASFATANITCYSNYKDVPVNFVGSIAHYFRDILEEVASNFRFKIGDIQKKPIHELVKYHQTKRQAV